MRPLLAVLFAFALSYPAGAQQPGDWAAWKHAKSVEILGKDWPADQSDYPIRIVCHQGKGTDGGANVYLGDGVRDDFGDVRFRADNRHALDHWLETAPPGKTATFWVKVPRIPKNAAVRIDVCFGNPKAMSASDGKKTFPFFDDFLGDYQGAGHKNRPAGWESTYQDGNNCNWIVKNGVIQFRGSGHLTTAKKVWPNPAKESYTLRARAKWPKPAFVNADENGQSFGGISWPATDGNAWMNLFVLYQNQTGGKITASFGSVPSNPQAEKKGGPYVAAHNIKYELKPFAKADHGSFFTFEIERKPDETINRIVDTGEEIRSKLVIPGDLHVMIHGCTCDFPNSAYLHVDWLLLRKQAYPNPGYGAWRTVNDAKAVIGAAAAQDGKAFTNTLGMKFARIDAGAFTMGQGDAAPKSRAEWNERDYDEAPAHPVKIRKAFYLGVHEVTNAQYEAFDPKHKELRGKRGSSKGDDEPVAYVTWHDAVAFCAWLAKKENRPYRLPTEAEWEYACRAGTTTKYHTGDQLLSKQANVGRASDDTPHKSAMKVGSYPPNAWGLHDMHGNVAEWCLDWHGPYEAGEQTDPVGRSDGYARITRGWSFLAPSPFQDMMKFARSSNRSGHLPEDANAYTGFRVLLGAMPTTKPLPVVLAAYQKDVKQGAPPHLRPLSPGGERGEKAKALFVNYVKEGKNPTIPKDAWGPIFSQHNHFSAVCVCPNGDVLACWYTCVTERGRELAQACSRLRAGSDKWDEASLFFDVPNVNDHAPVLFCDGKRIFHFCTQSLRGWDDSSNIVRWSDDNGVTWSHPKIMLTRDAPDRLSQPCSAFQAKDGTLVLACDGDLHVDERLMISKDRGLTWKVAKGDMRKAYGGKYVIHPAIVPTSDGAILSFLRGPHPMPVLTSKDWGDTWEAKTTPFPGIGGGQKIAAMRLASGAILLCSQDSKKQLVDGGTYAALSLDDGKTWPHVRKVEGVGGYMSVAQAQSGVIYLFGTRVGCAAFNEAWVKEGRPVGEK